MQQPAPSTPSRSFLERPLIRAAVALALLAALGGIVLLVQSRRDDGTSGPVSTSGAPTAAASAVAEAGVGPLDGRKPVKGQPAPDFILRGTDGKLVKLSDLRGQVVWVNFWASWCVPCKKEMPDIQKLYDEKREQGLTVLTINWQEDVETATAFFKSLSLDLPLLMDRTGSVYEQYRLQGLPDSFFIDRDGNIAAFQFGSLSESKMRERLAAAGLP